MAVEIGYVKRDKPFEKLDPDKVQTYVNQALKK